MGVTITDTDHGYHVLLSNVKGWGDTVVRVGVNEEQHGNSGLTNAEIGTFHEFGLGHNPQRSFIRGYVDQKQSDWLAYLQQLLTSAIFKSGGKAWVSLFGQHLSDGMKAFIRAGIPPELKDATIARKQSHNPIPLLDTEEFVNAIEYEVVK